MASLDPTANAGPERRSLYRESALEHLRSPEDVEGLMRVVGPSGWAVAVAFALVLAGAVYWSIFGSVATIVTGRGILGPAFGEVREVVASHVGVLRTLEVSLGDTVKVGDKLGSVEIYEALEDKRDAERTLKSLQNEHSRLVDYWDSYMAQQDSSLQNEAVDLDNQIKWASDRVDSRQRILDGMLDLARRGFATEVQVEASREEQVDAATDLAQARLKRQAIDSRRLELKNQRMTAMQNIEDRLLDAKERLSDAKGVLSDGGDLIADTDGRIVEVAGRIDAYVQPGSPILTIQAVRADLEGVFFVAPSQGKRVQEGMDVNVAPTIVEPERYGTIRAKVVWVTPEPQTDAAVARQIGNQTLAQSLIGSESPIAFGVTLEDDPKAPSGLKWTSGTGPSSPIPVGTIANADVVVKKEPPIVLVIPALRRMFGLEP